MAKMSVKRRDEIFGRAIRLFLRLGLDLFFRHDLK
jgi:hypothetical protein